MGMVGYRVAVICFPKFQNSKSCAGSSPRLCLLGVRVYVYVYVYMYIYVCS